MTQSLLKGACLCGSVQFTLAPPLRDVIVCHCRQCARWTGLAVAATAVAPESFKVHAGAEWVSWYRSSSRAERGFCARCGSSLFWKPADASRVAVLAGALDVPTGLKIGAHIFVDDKSDFYEICDGAPRFAQSAGTLGSAGL
jgi:hypothetical protein